MALNIPLPGLPGDALLKGVQTGGNLFSQIMHPILERERQKQLESQFGKNLTQRQAEQAQAEQHFLKELALRQKAENRISANSALTNRLTQQKINEYELRNNPEKLREFIQKIRQSSGNQAGGQMPSPVSFNGGGMMSLDNISGNDMMQPGNQPSSSGSLFGNLSPDEQAMLQMAGIKIPTVKENPETKRFAELRDKIKLENYKTEQKKILEQEKANLKNEATRQKTIDAAKNDLPHLELTLESLENMKKIATNNPDLFGHSGFMGFGAQGAAERFANTTDNPNAGAWQTYGLGPIVAAESKMSSKGNQLALKQALANKPNFSENQKVALSKIDSSIELIKKSIEDNKKLTGADKNASVIVIDPSGKRFETTKENAAHLPAGWKRG